MTDGISLGLFLCKKGSESKKMGECWKGCVQERGVTSLPDESAKNRQAHTHAVESKGDCAALAAVLITVHRQDWSALLDNHYCC